MKRLFGKYFTIRKHFYNNQFRISDGVDAVLARICKTPLGPLFFFKETVIALIFGRWIKGTSMFLLGEKK